jgi:hypothetical protein
MFSMAQFQPDMTFGLLKAHFVYGPAYVPIGFRPVNCPTWKWAKTQLTFISAC